MMDPKEIDHIGIAVDDLEAAIAYYQNTVGAKLVHREVIVSDKVEEAMMEVAESFLQLLCPTEPDSPVGRFLAKHGPGLHHLALRVDDCAEALDAFKTGGHRLIDETPRPGSRGTTVAFVHPTASFGTLIELVEERPSA